MKRGRQAFQEAKQRQSERGGSARQTYDFRLREDGDTAIVWFRGLFAEPMSEEEIDALDDDQVREQIREQLCTIREVDGKKEKRIDALKRRQGQVEPVLIFAHGTGNGRDRFGSFTCSQMTEGFEDAGPCVGCYACKQKVKTVKMPSEKFCYSLVNTTKQHRVSHGDKNEYFNCTADDGACKYCRKAKSDGPVYEARMIGRRRWVVGMSISTNVLALDARLQKKCRGCGTGKIRKTWVCGNRNCSEPLDVDSGEVSVRCNECGKKKVPVATFTCSNCDDPKPGSIMHCPVLITRSGSGKATTYNLEPQGFEDIPADVLAFDACNWAEEVKPPSPEEQALEIGLERNPFASGGKGRVGADSYDEDDEVEDLDDEEEERPKSSKSKSKKRRASDEDDDDFPE